MTEVNMEEFFNRIAISIVSNMPDNANDNEMQSVYDKQFNAGKEATLRGDKWMEELIGYNQYHMFDEVPRSPSGTLLFSQGPPPETIPRIVRMEIDYIDQTVQILTGVINLITLSTKDRIKIRRYLQFLEDHKKRISNPGKLRKKLTFKDLFINLDTAGKVDRIFEENGYTKEGIWIDSGKKKRIAIAFYVLKDPDPEINVIKIGNKTSQLRIFCNHYGIDVADKGGDVTIKNLLKRPEYEITEKPDYKEFMKLFNVLKEK